MYAVGYGTHCRAKTAPHAFLAVNMRTPLFIHLNRHVTAIKTRHITQTAPDALFYVYYRKPFGNTGEPVMRGDEFQRIAYEILHLLKIMPLHEG